MEGFLPRVACPEKARLLRCGGVGLQSSHSRVECGFPVAKETQGRRTRGQRKEMEDAWDALERHTSEHGC